MENNKKFYVAHALIFNETNQMTSCVFCGLFYDRVNAYKNIANTMKSYPHAMYIPLVKIGEILDSYPAEMWDWPMPDTLE